ncbi:dynamin family protein [Pseudonocardia oroxyli]|uniref:50S ribosome-binding GTPase n=1 Tax=Pseudonocardia oroxyli TaxID=366584 RepID=A0A1G7P6S7_PSEOR|nr:dynamin family protein [Pseudonocardia oroxyli]SDF81160.1 50S ribosome-binding GTPase [Pseudonocardia oroxyli]
MSTLLRRTRELVGEAAALAAGTRIEPMITAVAARIDEPLRVAIAGRVKAGKSTLLNALVGQDLAATDAGECTRIVTWFRHGPSYRVMLFPTQGPPAQLPFPQSGSLASIDLAGHTPDLVSRMVVDWPSRRLQAMTLIDTPGMGSINDEISARSRVLLTPEGPTGSGADAVVYLMRHMHADDVSFLEAFHETEGQGRPVNTVGVLARADEVGHARTDALDSAARIAARYAADPRVRRLCHTVVPVAGLLAACGATLRQAEYAALVALAALPAETREGLLLTTDRFISAEVGVDPATRLELARRLGLFGIRSSLELIASGEAADASALAAHLQRLSGITGLHELLTTRFAARADVLKARTAILALEALFAGSPPPPDLQRRFDALVAGAHELTELRLIDALREDPTLLPGDDGSAERLLGSYGADPRTRLGLGELADLGQVRQSALTTLARWQREAEDPLATRATATAARILVRTCEGMLV